MSTQETNAPKIISVKLSELSVHPVAKRDHYKETELKALGKSLRENGQLHPVLCREHDGKLELLAGTRRMRAAQAVGLKFLNATVCRATDAQALELIGVENLLRANLNPLERSRYVMELMRPLAYGGGGLSIDQVRNRFGRSSDWVRKTCKLSQMPEPWRSRLSEGKISESVCQALMPYFDRPAVLKSIERHQERNPKLWGSKEEWRRLCKMINATFEELGEKEGWVDAEKVPSIDREIKATLSPDPYAEERVDRQADKVDEAMEEAEVSEQMTKQRRLTLKAARGLIEPFADSANDLCTLRKAINARLEELEQSQ